MTDRPHRPPRPGGVAALLTGAAGLLLAFVGALGGSFVAGGLDALVPARTTAPSQVVIAVSVIATTALVTRWAAPWLLSRAHRGEPRSARDAVLPLVVGAAVVAPPVALSAAGPSAVSVLIWTVLLVGGVAAGAVLAARHQPGAAADHDRPTSGGRGPATVRGRWHHDDGAIAAEQIAVVVIVAVVVAALFALALPTRVGDWGSYAVCSLFGDECERPDGGTAVVGAGADWAPEGCTHASHEQFVEAGMGVTWVDLDTRQGYTTVAKDDGTYEVTYTGANTVGGSKSAGVWLEIHAGEESFATGASASAGAALRFEDGLSWEFGSEQEAQDWIDWHLRDGLVPEMVDNPLTRIAAIGAAGPGADQIIAGGRD